MADGPKDVSLIDREEILGLHSRGVKQSGCSTVRRGRVYENLSGLDRRESGISGDHRNDSVLEPSVIAVVLNDDGRPVLAAAARGVRELDDDDVAAACHDDLVSAERC